MLCFMLTEAQETDTEALQLLLSESILSCGGFIMDPAIDLHRELQLMTVKIDAIVIYRNLTMKFYTESFATNSFP